jgi:hypothetical protein
MNFLVNNQEHFHTNSVVHSSYKEQTLSSQLPTSCIFRKVHTMLA